MQQVHRCNELCELQVHDIKLNCVPYFIPHFKVHLDGCKGWQSKVGNEGPHKSVSFHLIWLHLMIFWCDSAKAMSMKSMSKMFLKWTWALTCSDGSHSLKPNWVILWRMMTLFSCILCQMEHCIPSAQWLMILSKASSPNSASVLDSRQCTPHIASNVGVHSIVLCMLPLESAGYWVGYTGGEVGLLGSM